MLSAQELWESILECDNQNDLHDECWRKLQNIAQNMTKYDFSTGNEKDVSRKIINSLGYKDIKAFKEASQLDDKVNFLHDFSKLWNTQEYMMAHDRIFISGAEIRYSNYPFKEDSLKKKFYAVVKSLGIKPLRKSGKFSLALEDLLIFFDEGMYEQETPMQAFLRWRLSRESTMSTLWKEQKRR